MNKVFLIEVSLDELVEKTALRVVEKLKCVLPEEDKSEEYLTCKQVADLLKISLPTLNKHSKQGLIPSSRVGRCIRYKKSDIEQVISNGKRLILKKEGGKS